MLEEARCSAALSLQMLLSLSLVSLRLARLTPNEVPAIASLLHKQFPIDGPYSWARATGLKTSNLENYLLGEYLPKIFQADGSIGCYGYVDKGTLVGTIINENLDLKLDYPGDNDMNEAALIEGTTEYAYSAFDSILSSSKEIFLERIKNSNVKSSEINYVGWIATSEEYKKKGIAAQLIQETTKHLLDKGYKYSVAFTISPSAANVFRANGYDLCGEIEYKSFKMKQCHPFRTLPDGISIMVQDLR